MSIYFNGTDSFIDLGNILDAGSFMTVSAWVIRDTAGVRMDIISKEEDGVANGWEMAILTNNLAEFGLFDGANYFTVQGVTTILIDTVYLITGSYSISSGDLKIYINGVLDNTTNVGSSGNNSSANLNIGRQDNDSRYFEGTIEDVRVYYRVLSQKEIETIYYAKGSDNILDDLAGRWLMDDYAAGTTGSGGGGDPYAINNLQVAHVYDGGGGTNNITLSYTVPSGLNNPVLIVCAGAEDDAIPDSEPLTCTFGGTSLTKQIGAVTTATYGAGSAIFTVGVTAGDSNTVTVNWASGMLGKIIQVFVVSDATDVINVTNGAFNNGGNSDTSFTTTAINQLGIVHHFAGNNNTVTGTTGAGMTLLAGSESDPAGTSGYSSRVGTFDASAIGAYNNYGFTLTSTPNRSSQTTIAINVSPGGGSVFEVADRSDNKYTGTINGTTSFEEMIAVDFIN